MDIFQEALYLAICLVALVNAQATTTVINDTSDTDIVTSYYSVCPSSTTVTLTDTTITCAGNVCGPPTQGPAFVTRTDDDGRTTIYRTETTILPHMCPKEDGICGATYTLSEECPCHAPKTTSSDQCPEWFTTTVIACAACVKLGGPETVTLTTPLPEGPYATVTPDYGPPVSAPAAINPSLVPNLAPDTPVEHVPAGSSVPAVASVGDNSASTSPAATNIGGVNNYTAPSNPDRQLYLGLGSNIAVPTFLFMGLVGILALML